MARRKNTRMFSREQRRSERAAQLVRARSITRADLDDAAIAMHLPGEAGRSPAWLAETWLGLLDEPFLCDHEETLRDAIARRLQTLTGGPVSREVAEMLVDFNREEL